MASRILPDEAKALLLSRRAPHYGDAVPQHEAATGARPAVTNGWAPACNTAFSYATLPDPGSGLDVVWQLSSPGYYAQTQMMVNFQTPAWTFTSPTVTVTNSADCAATLTCGVYSAAESLWSGSASVRTLKSARHELTHRLLEYTRYVNDGCEFELAPQPFPSSLLERQVEEAFSQGCANQCNRPELPAAENALWKLYSADDGDLPDAHDRWLIPSRFLRSHPWPTLSARSTGDGSLPGKTRVLTLANKHLVAAVKRILRLCIAAMKVAVALLTAALRDAPARPVIAMTVKTVLPVRYHRNSREPADGHHAPMRRSQPSAGEYQEAH